MKPRIFVELTTFTHAQITKERQMEFTAESDQEYLHELFGDDTQALFESGCLVVFLAQSIAHAYVSFLEALSGSMSWLDAGLSQYFVH